LRREVDRSTSAYASLLFNCEFQAGLLIRDLRRDRRSAYFDDSVNASRECHGIDRDLAGFRTVAFRAQGADAMAAARRLARGVDAMLTHLGPGIPLSLRRFLYDGYRYGTRALREINDVRRVNGLAPIP